MIECFCKQTNYKNVVKFKLFKDSGDEKLLPKIHNDFAATANLYVGEDTPIKKKNQITLIPTGVIIDQMHPGYGLMITPKRSLDIGIVEMGIIDADYNKEIFIKFINLSNKRILKKFEGIYTSRLLEFDNLLEPVNLKKNETGKIIDENNNENNNNNRINNNTYNENDNINKNILKRKLSQDYINEYIEF